MPENPDDSAVRDALLSGPLADHVAVPPPARENAVMVMSAAFREWGLAGAARLKSQLTDRLERLLPRDAARTSAELAQVYSDLRRVQDDLDEAMKVLSRAYQKLNNDTIPRAFEAENLSSFTTRDGYRVTVSSRLYASIKPDAKGQAYGWLRNNGLGDLITDTVNAGTLSAAARKELEEGRELPEDMFSVHYASTTSVTRTKS